MKTFFGNAPCSVLCGHNHKNGKKQKTSVILSKQWNERTIKQIKGRSDQTNFKQSVPKPFKENKNEFKVILDKPGNDIGGLNYASTRGILEGYVKLRVRRLGPSKQN